jgi:hypothetical protein
MSTPGLYRTRFAYYLHGLDKTIVPSFALATTHDCTGP